MVDVKNKGLGIVFLTGYHGTDLASANSIIKENRYNISSSDTEWLGSGIYFYSSITDAYNWKESKAILHSVIKINDDEYLDIDSEEGIKIFQDIIDFICESHCVEICGSTQKNQCAVARMIWDTYPKLKVISASFATEKTKLKTLIDKRHRRKEFCVRNNSSIKHTYLINRGDLDD